MNHFRTHSRINFFLTAGELSRTLNGSPLSHPFFLNKYSHLFFSILGFWGFTSLCGVRATKTGIRMRLFLSLPCHFAAYRPVYPFSPSFF